MKKDDGNKCFFPPQRRNTKFAAVRVHDELHGTRVWSRCRKREQLKKNPTATTTTTTMVEKTFGVKKIGERSQALLLHNDSKEPTRSNLNT